LNNILLLIAQLAQLAATFVPKAGIVPDLVTAAANLLKYIQEQSGMTTDEILARAGVTLDQNEKMLLEDQIRLSGV
jgi:predicted PhzF superfamily epimerase YddE/YHI9